MLGTLKKKGSSEFWNYLFEMNLDDNCEKKKCWECKMIGNEEGLVFNCTRSIGMMLYVIRMGPVQMKTRSNSSSKW